MLSLRQLGIKRGLPSDFFECTGMATGTGRWRWLACCQVNHSATSTWIFNFASQQQGKVICRVDVPGLADEQWPGSTRSVDGEGGGVPGSRIYSQTDPIRTDPSPTSPVPEYPDSLLLSIALARRVDQFVLMQTTRINSCGKWAASRCAHLVPQLLGDPFLETSASAGIRQSAKKFIKLSATHLWPTVRCLWSMQLRLRLLLLAHKAADGNETVAKDLARITGGLPRGGGGIPPHGTELSDGVRVVGT